jgi:hypothetical protein
MQVGLYRLKWIVNGEILLLPDLSRTFACIRNVPTGCNSHEADKYN